MINDSIRLTLYFLDERNFAFMTHNIYTHTSTTHTHLHHESELELLHTLTDTNKQQQKQKYLFLYILYYINTYRKIGKKKKYWIRFTQGKKPEGKGLKGEERKIHSNSFV